MEMAQLQEKAFRSQATSEAADVARSERAASEVAVTTRTDAVTSGIVRNARHADASVLARRTASEDAEAGTRRGGRPRESGPSTTAQGPRGDGGEKVHRGGLGGDAPSGGGERPLHEVVAVGPEARGGFGGTAVEAEVRADLRFARRGADRARGAVRPPFDDGRGAGGVRPRGGGA